jgi:uncharacterized membrane protein YphA (DoxX/SURF4 family)
MIASKEIDMAGKGIAAVRIATGAIFFLFAEYKVAGAEWAHGGFEGWIRGYVDGGMPVGFFRPVLTGFALVHPVLCAELVAWGEMAIAVSLLLGLMVRAASVGGAALMSMMALATWFAPGHGAALWKYFGANLDHLPLLMLFVIFYAAGAGDVWGLDGFLERRKMRAGASV